MRPFVLTLIFALTAFALAQEKATPPVHDATISITARGDDVRNVLHDLFKQSKKNFVLDSSVHCSLYLALSDVEFEEALAIIGKTCSLRYEIQNGIYFVSKAPASTTQKTQPDTHPVVHGKLSPEVLQKRVTTRLRKIDLRDLAAEMSRQTGVSVQVDKDVPAYKLDAYLIGTSLKYALDVITKATGLKYNLTENRSIVISRSEENRVVLIKPEG